ncbi:phospho-sugar mutase [Epidermidibacterium keratini]|uniref:Phospho-sugar mutase n=1 Tax=Epidermidibacterium keratini TaxID=1891644 RepID=A0A7L4YRD0_9ACTN|nr:phospho-sugar mutase [Epidermidibacterium keratini]QHC01503.1 phospho-sugar mutase [Epidermidibacterium keratini]
MPASPTPQELRERVQSWIADDPDESARAELTALVEALPDDAAYAELADRFAGTLEFGTAGLRGPLRAGPNGMNRAVVSRAAAGIAAYLDGIDAQGPVVIGYDARFGSYDFAVDTAQIIAGAGRVALLMPRHLPTPVLAFATRALQAAAGIMVTASHNPPQDNGYKVYLGGPEGRDAQIVPPADSEISRYIAEVRSLADAPRSHDYSILDDVVYDQYLDSVARVVLPDSPRNLRVVSTALHGVGGDTLLSAYTRAGFAAPIPVAGQQRPNPEFPGLAFPNPEEAGVMDDVLALAVAEGADLAIANDPDADRCAAGAPMREGWRPLRGDELGVLLADHLMRRGESGTFSTTIVSSSLLGAICQARGMPYAETLTGFKWIVRGPDETGVPLRFGYEEAIGFCVDPASVNDKDGISAAVLTAELAAMLKAEGSSIQQRLDEIYAEFGYYVTSQISLRVDDLQIIANTMHRLRAEPPRELTGTAVETEDVLPRTDALIMRGPGLRVVVRPSGTEPKLKAYLEVTDRDESVAAQRMAQLRADLAPILGA